MSRTQRPSRPLAISFAASAAAALLLSVGCRHQDTEEVAFPERVDEKCRTKPGCHQLFQELSQKRDYCFREYGESERPEDCDNNDLYWWALKDHIELVELRQQRQTQGCQQQAQQIALEQQKLAEQRRKWQDERERAARIDKRWRDMNPRKCALEGDEDTCYQLVRFIALGNNPHLDEAKAALASGQKVIDERKRRSGRK